LLEHDHIRLRRKLESVLDELNSIPEDKDPGNVYLERATEIVVAIEDEALVCLNSWKNFTSLKIDDIKCKEECIKELNKLVEDIENWFESDSYEFAHSTSGSFEFDADKNIWNISFKGNRIIIVNKSGLIQLASLLTKPDRQIDLKDLSNNAMKPSRLGSADEHAKKEVAKIAAEGGGFSIDTSREKGFESIKNGKEIIRIYEALSKQIETIEQSSLDYIEKHEGIEEFLDKFAKYIGKRNISLKEFRDKYFLKNILKENYKKNIRNNDPSIVSAEAVEKAIRRCIKMLQEKLPSLGNYLANSIKFRFSTAFYDNTDGKTWKIRF